MKIQIHDLSENGEIMVRGVYGPRTITRLLGLVNKAIADINNDLRKVLSDEQN